jgi:hypothetical protein
MDEMDPFLDAGIAVSLLQPPQNDQAQALRSFEEGWQGKRHDSHLEVAADEELASHDD